jgi:hypothetical protein
MIVRALTRRAGAARTRRASSGSGRTLLTDEEGVNMQSPTIAGGSRCSSDRPVPPSLDGRGK